MTANTPATRKAKGRNAAKLLREELLKRAPHLQPGDITVTPAGVTGPDLYLSPAALETYPFTFEVKNQETLRFWKALKQSESHAEGLPLKPIMAFKRNNEKMRVSLELRDFLSLLSFDLEKNL